MSGSLPGSFASTHRLLVRPEGSSCGVLPQDWWKSVEYSDPDASIAWESVRSVDVVVSEAPLCPICLDEVFCPRMASCGHTVCLPCALRNLKYSTKCCVCSARHVLKEYRPVRIQLVRAVKPYKVLNLRLVQLHGSISKLHTSGEGGGPHAPELGAPGWFLSRVVALSVPQQVRILLDELSAVDRSLWEEAWLDEEEAASLWAARAFVEAEVKALKPEEIDHQGAYKYTTQKKPWIVDTGGTQRRNRRKGKGGAYEERKNDAGESGKTADASVSVSVAKGSGKAPEVQESVGSAHQDEQQCLSKQDCILGYLAYQSSDGQCYFLDSLWVRGLMLEFTGSPSAWDSGSLLLPLEVKLKVTSQESVTADYSSRKKLRCLSHLPSGCAAVIVDGQLLYPKLSEDTWALLRDGLERKKQLKKQQRRCHAKEDRYSSAARARVESEWRNLYGVPHAVQPREAKPRLEDFMPLVPNAQQSEQPALAEPQEGNQWPQKASFAELVAREAEGGVGGVYKPTRKCAPPVSSWGNLGPAKAVKSAEERLLESYAPPKAPALLSGELIDLAQAAKKSVEEGAGGGEGQGKRKKKKGVKISLAG